MCNFTIQVYSGVLSRRLIVHTASVAETNTDNPAITTDEPRPFFVIVRSEAAKQSRWGCWS